MVNIAIVEDEETHAETLKAYLLRYAKEKNDAFNISVFKNAILFLENYTAGYDVIFMDIRMPYMNGMDAAQKLRELDEFVVLIFITSLTQYAVKGYEVAALDYIVKPIAYGDFAMKFTRAYVRIDAQKQKYLTYKTEKGTVKVLPREIAYCEVSGHRLVLHTVNGDLEQHATLRSVEEKINDPSFCKCNHCYLVNLRFVKRLSGDEVIVEYAGRSDALQISRNRKKPFTESLKAFWEGNILSGGPVEKA